MSSQPRRHDITIRQSTTFTLTLAYADAKREPMDLTGYTARMMIRKKLRDTTPVLTLTSDPGGGINIDGPNGRIRLEIPVDVTAGLPTMTGVYDLMLTPPSSTVTYPLVEGVVYVKDSVTRDD